MADTSKPKLKLIGEDGNAFAILGRAVKALKEGGQAGGDECRHIQEDVPQIGPGRTTVVAER